MPGHRQSALLLHGLSKPDQRWLLSQLPESDRLILSQHLAELKQLGIPAEPALLDKATGARAASAAGPLHAAALPMVQQMLADEPVWMVAQVLALAEWPWRDALLASLPDGQRDRVAAVRPAPLHPQAAERLMARLTERLALQGGLAMPAHRRGPRGPIAALRHVLGRAN